MSPAINGQLALLTPEGISLALVPAGPSRRALAYVVDLLIWLISVAIVATIAALILGGGSVYRGFLFIFLFVSYWGYPILFEVYGGGKTLGKRMFNLEVVRHDGLPVGWRESSLRNLMLVVDFMPFIYAAGLVSMLFDLQHRRLGDIVANTLVIHRERSRARQLKLDIKPEPLPFPLSPQQQRALIDFVERADRLSNARRLELADLAEQLTGCKGEASLQKLRAYVAGLTQ